MPIGAVNVGKIGLIVPGHAGLTAIPVKTGAINDTRTYNQTLLTHKQTSSLPYDMCSPLNELFYCLERHYYFVIRSVFYRRAPIYVYLNPQTNAQGNNMVL